MIVLISKIDSNLKLEIITFDFKLIFIIKFIVQLTFT